MMTNLPQTAVAKPSQPAYPVGTCVTLSILWEVTAPKPGNVTRGADFEDMTYVDFITGAAIVGPILGQARSNGIGATVLSAVRATQQAVDTNTNLGTLLLLAPLAAIPPEESLADGVGTVLSQLDEHDTHLVYQAIGDAHAGGLGQVEEADVHGTPPFAGSLVDAMRLASERDLIARQYINGFREVLQCAAPWIEQEIGGGRGLAQAIVRTQLRLLAEYPDSLIARKCGIEVARLASDQAAEVLASPTEPVEEYQHRLADFDFWLRSDGHRRNPGTTSDLIAAGLFVLLREGRLSCPHVFYEQNHD
jgi:triphosphoribosyl-dephospho-CoA synthase